MFGKDFRGRYGRLITAVGGAVAGGIAFAAVAPAMKKRAMRATTILKKDHRVVSSLFWTLQQATIPSIRKSIFNQIQIQLETHAQVEEELFYPAVRNLYTTAAEDQVNEANREHQKIRNLLHEISTSDPSSYVFMSKVNELKEIVEHHVEEEENEMFPLAQNNMSSQELDYIGRRIHDRKGQLKERIAA